MRNNTTWIGIVVLALVLWGLLAMGPKESGSTPTPSSSVTTQSFATVSYQGVEGQTAMALLKASHQVESKHFDFGDLVQSIDGQASDAAKYWLFYVDGKQADKGADVYATKNGQTIEWRLEPAS